ncbi:uncharacterized protein Z520_05083 [Fonsecaea multimorphosa CBS 102226]|uniref:F-box domain-containing protein n=1 Tax=Fonsecaea multimorphosa CBS 102226 TaxID=1442371 RepID=A0A0D2K128_9EURO|nr:uncharacterized protein Z520_05083 [Fonsecaea multimorphosa CBS 102226]KIX99507.1 hypothetical protein Z520_05083 [Fonsecaea multimorphosa CBS 102226]OAL25500.1 hypothetical protein AYO22_04819 [Fonsecaea multimorphosa]
MVPVTKAFRRASTANFFDSGSSSGESSRRPSAADIYTSRRPSLAALSLRLSSWSKKSHSSKRCEADAGSSERLWDAVLSLPDEITAQILCHLSVSDFLSLRSTSRSVHLYLQSHAGPVSRSLLLQNAYDRTTDYEGNINDEKAKFLYNYLHTLYPPPQPCDSFDYLLQMLKRQAQVERMVQVLINWIQMKVYVIPKFKRCDNFNPYKFKLMRRLHLPTWTIYHFLECYRTMLVTEHPYHPRPQSASSEQDNSSIPCRSCGQYVRDLLRTYPGTAIIPAYHFFELCRQHLRALSRAPSAGIIRSRKPPSEADLVQLVVFGGIPELSKLSLLKGSSNQRIEVIGTFVDKISSAAIQQRIGRKASPSSQSQVSLPSTALRASFDDLVAPLQPPFSLIHHHTISAIPELENFIIDSDEWVTRMYELVRPGDQIVSAWGFITNILAGKSDDVEDSGAETGAESDLDFLAPVKDLNT